MQLSRSISRRPSTSFIPIPSKPSNFDMDSSNVESSFWLLSFTFWPVLALYGGLVGFSPSFCWYFHRQKIPLALILLVCFHKSCFRSLIFPNSERTYTSLLRTNFSLQITGKENWCLVNLGRKVFIPSNSLREVGSCFSGFFWNSPKNFCKIYPSTM